MRTMTTRSERLIAAGISTVAVLFTWILLPQAAPSFRRFLGNLPPLAVAIGAVAVGVGCLGLLWRLGSFAILRRDLTPAGIVRAALAATLFGAVVVTIDLLLRYPRDINVPLPQALLFYPAIGVIAEVAFHLVPLTLLLLLFRFAIRLRNRETGISLAILIVAISEPVFQVTFSGEPFTLLSAGTLIHVFAFALVQLHLYRRYDFVSMYALRMFYYLLWHIIWGTVRLELLSF